MVADFWRELAEIGIPTFTLCAGIPQRMGGERFTPPITPLQVED